MIDFKLRPAPDARCPICRSLLTGMSGTHEFRMLPSERVRFDLFGDGVEQDVTVHPTPIAQDFIATFVPCGCQWHARSRPGLEPYILLIIGTDAGARFEFGDRQHDNRYAMYVMTHERT
jgi:hypothetical protein